MNKISLSGVEGGKLSFEFLEHNLKISIDKGWFQAIVCAQSEASSFQKFLTKLANADMSKERFCSEDSLVVIDADLLSSGVISLEVCLFQFISDDDQIEFSFDLYQQHLIEAIDGCI